jgi:hypothetical protein
MSGYLECLLTSILLDVCLWCKLRLVQILLKGRGNNIDPELEDGVEDLCEERM